MVTFCGSIITLSGPLCYMSNPPKNLGRGQTPPPLLGNARIFTASVTATPPLLYLIALIYIVATIKKLGGGPVVAHGYAESS